MKVIQQPLIAFVHGLCFAEYKIVVSTTYLYTFCLDWIFILLLFQIHSDKFVLWVSRYARPPHNVGTMRQCAAKVGKAAHCVYFFATDDYYLLRE